MLNVLVVEDSSSDLFWLKRVLAETGIDHALSIADDGQRAVDFLCKQGDFANAPTPDLILLDVHLPRLTGLEVLRRVPKAAQLPICVLTSSRAEQEMFKREFGIQGLRYLIKPVTAASLRECIRCVNAAPARWGAARAQEGPGDLGRGVDRALSTPCGFRSHCYFSRGEYLFSSVSSGSAAAVGLKAPPTIWDWRAPAP